MTEIKVGDRVKLVDNVFRQQKLGDEGVIVKIDWWDEAADEIYGYIVVYDRIPNEEFCERSDDIELVSRPTPPTEDELSHERLADSNEAKRVRLKKIKKKLKKLLRELDDVIVD